MGCRLHVYVSNQQIWNIHLKVEPDVLISMFLYTSLFFMDYYHIGLETMSPDLRASTIPTILVALRLQMFILRSSLFFIFLAYFRHQPAFQCFLVPDARIKTFKGVSHTGSRKRGVWNTESGFGESSPRNFEQNQETYILLFRCFIESCFATYCKIR